MSEGGKDQLSAPTETHTLTQRRNRAEQGSRHTDLAVLLNGLLGVQRAAKGAVLKRVANTHALVRLVQALNNRVIHRFVQQLHGTQSMKQRSQKGRGRGEASE